MRTLSSQSDEVRDYSNLPTAWDETSRLPTQLRNQYAFWDTMSAPRSGNLSSNQNPPPSRCADTLQWHTVVCRVISIQLSAADVLQSAAGRDDLHKPISSSEKEPYVAIPIAVSV